MGNKRSLELLRSEYERVLPTANRMRDAVHNHLGWALKTAGIQLAFPIEARVKALDSVLFKIGTQKVDVRKLKQLDDLVGIRVVVLFTRDLQPVLDLVKELFVVKKETDTAERLPPKEFGYKSIHCVLKPSADMLELEEFRDCSGMGAEVQIRTVSQHCWAAVSHKLQYKYEENIPDSVKRPLHRVAALLELIDLEFERVLTSRETYLQSAPFEPEGTPLNIDNLEALLRQHFPDQRWWLDAYDISHVLEDLRFFGVDTRGCFNNLISYYSGCIYMNSADSSPCADEIGHSQDCDEDFVHPDESPDTVLLNMLALEYPERFEEYQHIKCIEAFRHFAPSISNESTSSKD